MNVAMMLVFLSLGMLFLCTSAFREHFPTPRRYWIGGVLILWSLFRAYTSYNAWKDQKSVELMDDDVPEEISFDIQDQHEKTAASETADKHNNN
jgi:hypothetical protein